MITRVVAFALRQPLFVMLLVAIFIGAGVYAFETLPIEAFPDVSDTQVQVITLFPGRAPARAGAVGSGRPAAPDRAGARAARDADRRALPLSPERGRRKHARPAHA